MPRVFWKAISVNRYTYSDGGLDLRKAHAPGSACRHDDGTARLRARFQKRKREIRELVQHEVRRLRNLAAVRAPRGIPRRPPRKSPPSSPCASHKGNPQTRAFPAGAVPRRFAPSRKISGRSLPLPKSSAHNKKEKYPESPSRSSAGRMQRAFVLETIPIGIPRAARACKSARAPGTRGHRLPVRGKRRLTQGVGDGLDAVARAERAEITRRPARSSSRTSGGRGFGGAISPRACKYAAPMPSQTPTESRSVPSKSNKRPFAACSPSFLSEAEPLCLLLLV